MALFTLLCVIVGEGVTADKQTTGDLDSMCIQCTHNTDNYNDCLIHRQIRFRSLAPSAVWAIVCQLSHFGVQCMKYTQISIYNYYKSVMSCHYYKSVVSCHYYKSVVLKLKHILCYVVQLSTEAHVQSLVTPSFPALNGCAHMCMVK